jgi:hypothetical protein
MKKELLIEMLQLGYKGSYNRINNLILQLSVDPELLDIVNMDSFSNEFYSVRDINYIKQCFTFKLK